MVYKNIKPAGQNCCSKCYQTEKEKKNNILWI